MLPPLFYAIAACFIWGTIFVVPQFLSDFSPLEVGLGRYFFYGLFSLVLFLKNKNFSIKKYSRTSWKAAFLFAFLSNIFYYPPLVIGIRFATAPVAVLIVGMCPLLIAIYGNYKTKETSFRSLLIPFLCIFLGIFLAHASEVDFQFPASSVWQYLLGLAGALCALVSWSIFAVHNSQFLKKHPEISQSEWSTVLGLATLICTTLLLGILSFMEWGIDIHKFLQIPWQSSLKFMGGIAFLGIVCSWIGCFLWNQASSHLPISLIGPLAIFETLFGLGFVFLEEGRRPTLIEIFGIVLMLGSIIRVLQLYHFRKIKT